MGGAKILVVANPYEAARIASWLDGGGLPLAGRVRTGDGGDETLSAFAEDPADLVVLAAGLDTGDSLMLAGALRADGPSHLRLVLIGDDRGPVRTALDAVEYAADRFLRRPLAANALVYAVRSCLEPKTGTKPGVTPARAPTQPLPRGATVGVSAESQPLPRAATVRVGAESQPQPQPRAVTVGGVAGGLAGGLAGLAVMPASSVQATSMLEDLARAPTEPPAGNGAALAADVASSGVAAAAAAASPDLLARLDAVTSSMLAAFLDDAVSRTVDAAVGSELRQAVEYTAEPGDAERELLAPQITSDFEPAPPWREPTLILSAGTAAAVTPIVAAPDAVMAAVAASAASGVGSATGDTLDEDAENAAGLSTPPAGTLARELRRTMSAIEKRLFGDDGGDDQVSDMTEDEPDADIDLDKIGGATSPGYLTDLSDAPTRTAAPEATFVGDTGIFDATGIDTALHAPERAGAAPAKPIDLAREDTAALLARLHREGFSGRLTFVRDDVHKVVFLDGGRPVFANSNLPHDRMGDLLYREGKITREQFARSREIVAGTGRRMGEILVEMGFLKRRELLPAVRRHVEDIIFSLFAWDSGQAMLSPGDSAQDEKIRLATHPTALLFEGIRRKMDLPRLRARVGSDETVLAPLKRDEIAGALAEADLALEERAAADLFDGRRTLADVVAQSRIDATSVWQLAHALLSLGFARAFERGRELSDPGRGAGGPTPTPLAGPADVAIDRERVLAKHAHVLEADYFQVLGVRRDASGFELKRAWEAARRDYAPEAFPLEVQRELGEPLREVAAIVDEAYRVLRDGVVRAQYLENLKE